MKKRLYIPGVFNLLLQTFYNRCVNSQRFFLILFKTKLMRGEQALYLPYFCDESDNQPTGRGRSNTLILRRDRKLILRYYFHTYFKRLKYDDTIRQLILEFDLAERTITDRLQMNNDQINDLMKARPMVHELKKEVPFFAW